MTWGFTAVAGANLVSGAMSADAAGDAADTQAGATQAGIDEQRRQFDITQENLQPYLGAGRRALDQYQFQMGQQPQTPRLDQYSGIQPQFEQFQFDPQAALNNPALQFQQEMGTQAMERQAGKNRLLGSGQRLIEAQRFGQGLASQSMGEEFSRQLASNQQRNQVTGQQFGADRALAQQEQNRLLAQYGLSSDAFNQRLNRLAGLVDVGRGTGGTLAQAGQQSANSVSNLLQAQGSAQAAGQLGQANAIGGTMQNLAGIYGYMGGGNPFGSGQNQLSTAQRFGTVPGSQQTNMLAQQNLGF